MKKILTFQHFGRTGCIAAAADFVNRVGISQEDLVNITCDSSGTVVYYWAYPEPPKEPPENPMMLLWPK